MANTDVIRADQALLTLPQILHTKGVVLQFQWCPPVGDLAHFHVPEAIYSFSDIMMGLL